MPKSVAIHTKLVASTAVAFGALTLAAPNVSAQLWYYEAGASFGTFYDDNPQLASGSSSGSFGGTLNAAAWVGRSTEASDIGISLAADRRLFTDASDLDMLDSASQYQLWLIKDGNRTSGGVFSVLDNSYGVLVVNSSESLSVYDGFGVTIEPAGGSQGPTGSKVLGGNI